MLVDCCRDVVQWGKKDGNNARWYYPIIFKTLFYAQVAGDREEVDAPRATKVSMVTFAGNEFLSFYTDYVGGTNRFIVIGVQQWGFIPANVGIVTWIYPIKFTSVYSLVTTRYAAYFDSLTQYSDKEMALCYINVDKCRINRGNETTERIYVIAIGQAQQWGYKESLTAEISNYPIPFTTFCHVIAFAYTHSSSGSTAHAVIKDKTNLGFNFYIGQYSMTPYPASDATGWWLAWGIQQWGYCPYTEDNNAKIMLPITYAIKHYIAVSSAEDTYGGSINITGIWELTLTDFVLAKSAHARSAFWISLGCQQQWGVSTQMSISVVFPVAYKSILLGVQLQSAHDGTSTVHFGVKKESLTGFSVNVATPQSQFQSFRLLYWIAVGI